MTNLQTVTKKTTMRRRLGWGMTLGFIVGLLLVFALVVAHGARMRSASGNLTSTFLSLPVLRSSRHLDPAGGSQVDMVPLPGMLVPLLGPMLLLFLGHLLYSARLRRLGGGSA